MKRLQRNIFDLGKSKGYKVLNHGDAWVNNFMFTYKDGKPEEVIFVDYQLCWYTSPGIDLNYFFNTSTTNDVREKQFSELMEHYYREFSRSLKQLDVKKIPSLDDLYDEYSRCEFYGFMAAAAILPILLLQKENSQESHLEKVNDEEAGTNMRNAMYFNDTYQTAVKPILLRFENNGVLDRLCETL